MVARCRVSARRGPHILYQRSSHACFGRRIYWSDGPSIVMTNDSFPRAIGLLTGGGDAPGLNAVIRAVVKSAFNGGCDCIGLENSFDGLIDRGRFACIAARRREGHHSSRRHDPRDVEPRQPVRVPRRVWRHHELRRTMPADIPRVGARCSCRGRRRRHVGDCARVSCTRDADRLRAKDH